MAENAVKTPVILLLWLGTLTALKVWFVSHPAQPANLAVLCEL